MKKKKKKERRKVAKDRGPFGSGSKVDYGKVLEVSSGSSTTMSRFFGTAVPPEMEPVCSCSFRSML